MRIAVLSDIHSNIHALEAVLDDIKKHIVNEIIIAGDLTGDGPHPNEVIRRLSKVTNHIIKGNREEYMIKLRQGEAPDWFNYEQMSAVVWTYNQLTDDNFEFINNLSEQIVIHLEGTDPIRVVHGSLFDISELIYPDKHIERLNKTLENLNESVLICGHTHEQWSKRYNDKLIVNPGSVGLHFNESISAEYALLEWNENRWDVELKRVSYDINELFNSFTESGLLEESTIWTKSIIEGLSLGRDISIEFLRFAYDLAEKEEKNRVEYVPNQIWRKADLLWKWKTTF